MNQLNQQSVTTWPLMVRGILALILGVLAIAWPGVTAALVVLWIGAYFIVDGIFTGVVAIRSAIHHRPRWLLLTRGILGVIVGCFFFIWPEQAALLLVLLIGIWSVIAGIFEIFAAFTMPWPKSGRILVGIAGALSILFGTLLFTYPADGILVILWLLAVYAFIFGILMIASAVGLKNVK